MHNTTAYDEMFVQYALSLAAKGSGRTGINPLVGAVVVKHGRIVGQGFHRKIGEAHAEAIALQQAGRLAHGAHLYVNLEPCCTYGYTPPCVNAIIEARIKRVIIATRDPNPAVNGKSIQILRKHNVRVDVDILNDQAKNLNRWYLKYITTKIPYVILKIATTKNMKISGFSTRYVTSEPARRYVHALRSQVGAVLVGINTVLIDNPLLTDRLVGRHNPARIVIDPHLKTPLNAAFIEPNARRIILTKSDDSQEKMAQLKKTGVEFVFMEGDDYSTMDLLKSISALKIGSVLVEGGGVTFDHFLRDKAYDELFLFVSPATTEDGIGVEIDQSIIEKNRPKQIGEDLLYHVYRNN
jgi:diaminohydroxyphosphoribosylaminopyrimidine deaminase/5-amino-6-(5-phosphoribosylamino)uracil reductase